MDTGMLPLTPSPEQQKVIDHRGGHLQVIACAGAGKTEAISRRVASLTTLFEHDAEEFEWTDKDVAVLDRLAQKAGAELLQLTVRKGKRVVVATQHVGVFRLGNRTVQVLPKIYRAEETTDPAKGATRNLLHMLQIANEVQIREQGLAKLLKENMDWFEILTRLFALHLREEWQRGPSRGYLLVEDDLPLLKGKWRVAEQIRRLGRDHLFSVAYDEFTADIPLNRVFRFVVRATLDRDTGRREPADPRGTAAVAGRGDAAAIRDRQRCEPGTAHPAEPPPGAALEPRPPFP